MFLFVLFVDETEDIIVVRHALKPATTKWWNNLIEVMSHRIFTHTTNNDKSIKQYFGTQLFKMNNEKQIMYLTECQIKIEQSIRCFIVKLWNNFYRQHVWQNNSTQSVVINNWTNDTDLLLTFNIRKQRNIQGLVMIGFSFHDASTVYSSNKNSAASTCEEKLNNQSMSQNNNDKIYETTVHPQLKKANERLLDYQNMQRKVIELENTISKYEDKFQRLLQLVENEKKSTNRESK